MNWACIGLAGSLTLEWDPSQDPDVVAYQLYYGSDSGQYTNGVFAGPITTATIDNLAAGVTYYFTVTSLNSSGLESDFAPELSHTMPAPSSIPAPSCFIVLSNMDQIYDGTPKTVSAITLPGDFGYVLTYDGAPDPPVDAGSYWVAAISTDPTCPTTTTGLLTIEKASASIQFDNLDQAYDGSAKKVAITTTPPGLNLAVTYNGMLAVPTEAGIYGVSAWIVDNNYTGSVTNIFYIAKAQATIQFLNLDQKADGTPKAVTATTQPPGLNVQVSYNGQDQPPSAAGTYAALATIDDMNYQGSALATLTILPGTSASRNPSQPDVNGIASSLPPTARTQQISVYWPDGFSGVVLWSSTNLVDWTLLTNAPAATHSIALPQGTVPTFYRATANAVGGVSSPPLSIRKF